MWIVLVFSIEWNFLPYSISIYCYFHLMEAFELVSSFKTRWNSWCFFSLHSSYFLFCSYSQFLFISLMFLLKKRMYKDHLCMKAGLTWGRRNFLIYLLLFYLFTYSVCFLFCSFLNIFCSLFPHLSFSFPNVLLKIFEQLLNPQFECV